MLSECKFYDFYTRYIDATINDSLKREPSDAFWRARFWSPYARKPGILCLTASEEAQFPNKRAVMPFSFRSTESGGVATWTLESGGGGNSLC